MRKPDKANLVYRYTPKTNWCRHGLARSSEHHSGKILLRDTYWGSSGDPSYWVEFSKLDSPEFLVDLDNFEPARNEWEWKIRKIDDRFSIPMGGSSTQFFTREGSEPDPDIHLELLRMRLHDAEDRVTSGVRFVVMAQRELTLAEVKYGREKAIP